MFGYGYSDPFPWDFGDPAKASPNYAMFAVESANGTGQYPDIAAGSLGDLGYGNPVTTPHWMPTFPIPDVYASTKQVTELGGKVINPIRPSVFGEVVIVTDAQGAPFQLVTAQK